MGKRYAIVAKVRKQVVDIVEDLTPINQEFHLVIDLSNYPQKEEVAIDWFYDIETNTFSKEGEVSYPEPEPIISELTQLDRIEAGLAYGNMMEGSE